MSTVWLFNRVYHPNTQATAALMTDLCQRLGARLSLRVVCGVQGAADAAAPVPVDRPRSTPVPGRGLLAKAWGYLSYFAFALARAARVPKTDQALIWTDPPFLDTVLGLFFHLRGVKYSLVLQDVYPQVLVASGLLPRGGGVDRVLRALQKRSHQGARALVCISEDTRRMLAAAYPVPNAVIIPNWSVEPAAATPPPIAPAAAGAPVVVEYGGNLGYAFDLDTLEKALALLPRRERLRVVIRGDGGKKAAVLALAARCPEVVWEDRLALAEHVRRKALSDAQLILTPPSFLGVVYPSKLYSILSSGLPVLASVPEASEMVGFLRGSGAGLAAAAERPAELAARLDELWEIKQARPEALVAMRAASLAAARSWTAADAADTYAALLSRLASAP